MAMCRACRRDETAAAAPSRPEPENGHPAVLLLRVWHQDDELRCRLLPATDPSSTPRAGMAAQGVDAICAAVRDWLGQV